MHFISQKYVREAIRDFFERFAFLLDGFRDRANAPVWLRHPRERMIYTKTRVRLSRLKKGVLWTFIFFSLSKSYRIVGIIDNRTGDQFLCGDPTPNWWKVRTNVTYAAIQYACVCLAVRRTYRRRTPLKATHSWWYDGKCLRRSYGWMHTRIPSTMYEWMKNVHADASCIYFIILFFFLQNFFAVIIIVS